ncbi:hypothetical protein PJL15_04339 [Paenarthrobacter nitroguajacolicus]|nr:hypothetical protein [Paenarthrobacter nitroguajacolicus]
MLRQVQMLIDSMTSTSVIVHSNSLDVLAANALDKALFDVVFRSPTRKSEAVPANLASFVSLDPAAMEFYRD